MTAEIAILNKSAVALAADSAMTLSITGKTFPSNKLFALTKWHPVGVMIYNNAEFMGVPWETIIKLYRRKIGKNAKLTIHEYVEDFLKFLSSTHFCTEEQLRKNFLGIAHDIFQNISRKVTRDYYHRLHSEGHSFSVRNLNRAFKRIVDGELQILKEEIKASESLMEVDAKRLVLLHQNLIDERINEVFEGLRITNSIRCSLHNILQSSIKSTRLSSNHTGIVIAGFGDDEIFPALYEVTVDGIIEKKLKHNWNTVHQIGQDSLEASLIPFAQIEMVNRFMEGVDPRFLNYIEIVIESLLQEFGNIILDELNLGDDEIFATVQDLSNKTMINFIESIEKIRYREFINPITSIIRSLPKEELGSMAEAMINLTSLKRRVSREQETVGGPVDVAIISKGDGFVWRKRKHYFDATLNRDFLNRQY